MKKKMQEGRDVWSVHLLVGQDESQERRRAGLVSQESSAHGRAGAVPAHTKAEGSVKGDRIRAITAVLKARFNNLSASDLIELAI